MGYIDLQAHSEYLDHVNPAYRDWRNEARSHPEQANLCNADLNPREPGRREPECREPRRCFPPTILISGTRDLLLSTTVRTHRKMREAGVIADLNVFEALSHAEYITIAPESAEAFGQVAAFFDRYLSR